MLHTPKPVAPERTIFPVDCISFPPVFGQLEANVGLSYLPKRELTICGCREMITVGLVMPEARNQGTPRPKHGQVLAFWSIVPFFHFHKPQFPLPLLLLLHLPFLCFHAASLHSSHLCKEKKMLVCKHDQQSARDGREWGGLLSFFTTPLILQTKVNSTSSLL